MTLAPRTLRWRVTAAATAAIVAVLVVVGWGLLVNHRRQLTANLDEQMNEIAAAIAADVGGGEPSDLERLGEVDWVAQLTSGGEVVAASRAIADLGPLGRDVDGDQLRNIGPLPGGDDDPLRLLTKSLETADGPLVIHLAAPRDDIADSVATLRGSLLVAIPLAAGALAVLTWILVGRTLRPVERMRSEVAAIGGADLHRRLPVPRGGDEISRLAATMNDMLARVEHSQVRQHHFVADASHELRSPLTRMRTELEVDLHHPETADREATERSVLEEVVGLQQLVDDLLLLARHDGAAADPSTTEHVDLGDVVGRVLQHPPQRDGVAVRAQTETPAPTSGRGAELDRAVANLLDNAVRHASSSVLVSVHRNGAAVSIAVADDGPGVPEADRDRIFERFARVDTARSAADGGTGLGLSIARDIVERNGGTLAVDPTYAAGARFVITLPSA